MELLIEKLVYGGDSLARQDGKVIMTPFALPGEKVQAEAERSRKDLTRGRVTKVMEASPHRIEPGCPYFFKCGGCQYQHAGYSYQLEQKTEILREVLRRVGKFEAPEQIGVISGPEWQYRNRIQLHYDGRRLGYHEQGTHNIVAVDKCPISSPKLNEAIKVLQGMARNRRWPEFLRTIELFTNEERVQFNVLDSGAKHLSRSFFEWVDSQLPGALDSALQYGGFRVSHRSFFQVNRHLVDQLVDAALGDAAGDEALDLYAGVGLFSRKLVDRFKKVTAVEAVNSAVADLQVNVPGAAAVRNTSEVFLEALGAAPGFAVADPPRAGLGPKVTSQLLRLRIPRVSIVSCDPATLARDLAALRSAYQITGMTMIDLFPQTAGIETVAHLALV